jgi:hypothetical protein
MIMGFIFAARLWEQNLWIALIILSVGVLLGVLIMHFTEPKLHQEPYEPGLKGDIINFILFMVLSIPFIFYFNAENRWINWKTDIIAGLIVGVLLTLGQSLSWEGPKSRMVMHGFAMAISFPLILLGIRYILQVESIFIALVLGFLVTVLASIIIVSIDYRDMFLRENSQSNVR